MMKSTFLFLFFFSFIYLQMINVQTCSEFKGMIAGNTTIIYNITQNISCSTEIVEAIGAGDNSFKGKILGNSFTISDLIIYSTLSGHIGIFASGNGCNVSNLNLNRITIQSTGKSYSGSLFGYCTNGNSCLFHLSSFYL